MRGRQHVRVLAVVPYPLGSAPGQRYRIEQWAPYLAEDHIELHFAPFSGEALAESLYQPGRYLGKAALMIEAWLATASTRGGRRPSMPSSCIARPRLWGRHCWRG